MGLKKWFNRSVDVRDNSNINIDSNEVGVTMVDNDISVSVSEPEIRQIEAPRHTLEEQIALAKSLGLDRQVKILKAEQYYERCNIEDIALRILGATRIFNTDYFKERCYELQCSLRNGGVAVAFYGPLDRYNREIPYAGLEAIEEAKKLDIFDAFHIVCPLNHVSPRSIRSSDPVIVGVIYSDNIGILHPEATYTIFGWDIPKGERNERNS